MKRQAGKLFRRERLRVRLYAGVAAFMILIGWAVLPRAAGIITTEAQSSCVTPPSGLVAWYPFEGNANDIQGGNNATVSGNAAFTAGKVGQALQLDGSTASAKVNASSTINVGAGGGMTVDAWIDPADVSSNQPLVEWNSGSGGKPYGVHLWISVNYQGGSAGDLFANIIDTNGNDHVIYSPNGIINANTFQHVALTYDKSDGAHGYAQLYVNGVAQPLNGTANTVTDLGVFTPQTSYDMYFGFRPAGAGSGLRYKGLMDEIELFNRALSPTEVQNIFNAGGSPRCAPPDRIQFATATYTHIAQGSALLTVTRTNAQSAAAVRYATSDGTATAGTDYTATSGTLSFAAGESSKTISIPITTKTVPGPDKTVNVTLSNATGDGVLGTPATAVLTISGAVGRILTVTGNADLQGLVAFNADAGGSNRISLTDLRYGNFAQYPSVSRQTGMIAFQGCGNDFPSPTACAGGRVFVMNADATGVKQLTFAAGLQDPNNQGDHSPVISPDGTKVAFVSGRSRYPVDAGGNTQNEEVFVVNVDGTNLHQVTTKQNVGSDNSRAYSVAWGPDSSKLVVRGTRLYHETVNGDHIIEEVFTVNLDGSGEKVLAVAVGGSDLRSGDLSFPLSGKAVDWSPDGNSVVFPVNYAPASNTSGVIDYVIMNPANPSANHLITHDQLGASQSGGYDEDGSVRFSPDSQQIVYGSRDDSSVRRTNLDGTNQFVILPNDGWAHGPKWWMGGAAIPQPARFTLTPNPASFTTGQITQMVPTLYDADGNVIVHAGVYQSGLYWGAASPTINFNYQVTGGHGFHNDSLCMSNAGLTSCAAYGNYPPEDFLTVTATTPAASNAKKTPGAFTISRAPNSTTGSEDALTVYYTLGGTAAQGADYTVDAPSPVTIPAGQMSVTINATPTGNSAGQGDKTIVLTLLPATGNQYGEANQTATVTIKDDAPPTNTIRLTSITPNTGGNIGVVTVTIYGSKISANSAVKLVRAGQTDIAASNVSVTDNGEILTATFDLTGQQIADWNVTVTNPDGSSATLPTAFKVAAGKASQVWIDLVGNYTMRGGKSQTLMLEWGNRGNVDALPTKFTMYVPGPLAVSGFPGEGAASSYSVSQTGDGAQIEFYSCTVPAGSKHVAPFTFTAPQSLAHHVVPVSLTAYSDPSLVSVCEEADEEASLTFNPHIDSQTPTSVDVTQNVTGTYKGKQINDSFPFHISVQSTQTAIDPDVDISDDGTGKGFNYQVEVTVPEADYNAVVTSSYDASVNSSQGSRKGVLNGGGGLVLIIEKGHMLYETYEAIEHAHAAHKAAIDAIDITKLAECLLKLGRISKADFQTITNHAKARVATNGSLAATKVGGVIGWITGVASGVTAMFTAGTKIVDGILQGSPLQKIRDALAQDPNAPEFQAASDLYNDKQGSSTYAAHLQAFIAALKADCPDCSIKFKSVSGAGRRVGTSIADQCPLPSSSSKVVGLLIVDSDDPNAKQGSQGVGDAHFISGEEPLRYTVSFENRATATAPAQTVVVTDQLDAAHLDLSTFALGAFGFGTSAGANVPDGLSSYSTDVDLRPQNNLIVHVSAALDKQTGLLTWSFTSIDPATGKTTTDPTAGFLPPDKNPPEGQGIVAFSVMPKAGLATGTQISNTATIVFDKNAPIATNTYTNTIDNSVPSSHVVALAAHQTSSDFTVNWSGTDTGSGVQTYDIYVSDNGGAFSPWLLNTTATSALYSGLAGHTYAFYSVAHDAAGNAEGAKTATEATTTTPTTAVQFSAATYTVGEGDGRATLNITRTGDTSGTSSVLYQTLDNPAAVRCDDVTTMPGVAFARCDYATVSGTLTFNPGETTKTITVPIIDDSYVEPDETFVVRLSSPLGAGMGDTSSATVTIKDNDQPGNANPIDATDFFVRQQYLDFLSREPDAPGAAAWAAALSNCKAGDASCDRITVSADFFLSQEFQLKGFFVFRFYKAAFGRLPHYTEIVADMSSVTGSTAAELVAKKAAFTTAFAQRAEFTSAYGSMSDAQYVATLMDRYSLQSITTPDPASPDGSSKVPLSRADLVNRLTAGTLTRAQVLRAVSDSDQVSAAEFNPAFVAMQYFGYLRRDPEAQGYADWLRAINANPSDTRSMVSGFVNSVEYRLRFGNPAR